MGTSRDANGELVAELFRRDSALLGPWPEDRRTARHGPSLASRPSYLELASHPQPADASTPPHPRANISLPELSRSRTHLPTMVGKKSGRSLLRDEGTPVNARAALCRSARREHHCFCMLTSAMWPSGLERTDNNLDLTTWPQVSMINQKNYYTSVFPRFLSNCSPPSYT